MNSYKGIKGNTYILEDKPLGEGGEGSVYGIVRMSNLVAKIYKPEKRDTTRRRKLEAMLKLPFPEDAGTKITWPKDILFDSNGDFVGFVMVRLNKTVNLNMMYSEKYAYLGHRRMVVMAKNLCAAISVLHSMGQVFGDLNPNNIAVSPDDGIVSLVDTDSFHITDSDTGRTYRCEVGLGEYIAPEVHRKMKTGVDLRTAALPTYTEYSDRFALAVHIFALLMKGCHPFACAMDMSKCKQSVALPSPVDNINAGVFPFINNSNNTTIPIYAPPIKILPGNMQALFYRAFVEGRNNPEMRPDCFEWHQALSAYEKALKKCPTCQNEYFSGVADCPWCAIKAKLNPKKVPVMGKGNSSRISQTSFQTPLPPVMGPMGGASQSTTSTAGGTGAVKKKSGCFKRIIIGYIIFNIVGFLISYAVESTKGTSMVDWNLNNTQSSIKEDSGYTVKDLTFTEIGENMYLNEWNAKSHKGTMYIGTKPYKNAIGGYLRSAEMEWGEVKYTGATFSRPYDAEWLYFDFGPDGTWDYSADAGEYCVSVWASGQKELYNSGWGNYKMTGSAEVNISGYEEIGIYIDEIKGEDGTLNIVFGDVQCK